MRTDGGADDVEDGAVTRDRLWITLAILLPALAATIAPMSTVDLAYQVRAGELMLGSLSVLREDPFTFTAMGDPWLNQQWGRACSSPSSTGSAAGAGWPCSAPR